MSNPDKTQAHLKTWIVHEVSEYWMNVCYLAVVFAAFTQYRRLILAAHDITYTNYWVALIKALILAKVIMVGSVFRLGRGLEEKPLIYPTLYKTVVFTVFVGLFALGEHAVRGLWQGEGVTAGLDQLLGEGTHELLANSLVVFVAFLPYFGVKELGRILGADKIRALFFQKRADQ